MFSDGGDDFDAIQIQPIYIQCPEPPNAGSGTTKKRASYKQPGSATSISNALLFTNQNLFKVMNRHIVHPEVCIPSLKGISVADFREV